MSEYLVHLVRRGAGLPIERSPQPRTEPDFFSTHEGTGLSVMDALANPLTSEADLDGGEGTASQPRVARPEMPDAPPNAPLIAPRLGMAAPSSAVDLPASLPASGMTMHAAPEAREEITEPSPRARSAPAKAGLSLELTKSNEARTPAQSPATAAHPPASAPPRLEPRWLDSELEPASSPTPSAEALPRENFSALGETAHLRPWNSWESAAPPEVTGETRAPLGARPSPRIEVKIGRVELRVTQPPAPAKPSAPQRPHGFDEYARARRGLDRKWY